MKKTIYKAIILINSLFTTLIFLGCKTTEINIRNYSPVAIASVYCNPSVPWYTDDPTAPDATNPGVLSNMVNNSLNKNNPELITLNERIDSAAESLCGILEDNGIDVLDASELAQKGINKQSSMAWLDVLSSDVPASGYKALGNGGKSRNRKIAEECGAQSLLFAHFVFQKKKVPIGHFDKAVAAMVTLKIYVCDAQGNKLLSKSYEATSSENTRYKNGNWDQQAVCDFFPSVIENVINQFVKDYVPVDSSEVIQETTPSDSITPEYSTSIPIPESFKSEKTDISNPTSTTPSF